MNFINRNSFNSSLDFNTDCRNMISKSDYNKADILDLLKLPRI